MGLQWFHDHFFLFELLPNQVVSGPAALTGVFALMWLNKVFIFDKSPFPGIYLTGFQWAYVAQ